VKNFLRYSADSIFVARPILLIPVWGLFILGHYRASLLYHPETLKQISLFQFKFHILPAFFGPGTGFGLFIFSLLLGGAYILNQLVDLEADRNNEGLPLIAKGGFPIKLAVVENALLFLIPSIFALWKGGHTGLFLALSLALSVMYSAKPFQFTGRPFFDFVSNAAGYGILAFGLGWAYANNGAPLELKRFFWEAAPYFLLIMGGSINSTVPDEPGDKKAGKNTTVVFMGTQKAGFLSSAAVLGCLLTALHNGDPIPVITAGISLPFYLRYAITNKLKNVFVTYQHCSAIMMVLAVIVYPQFLIYGLLTFGLTRLYFKKRHGLSYPHAGA